MFKAWRIGFHVWAWILFCLSGTEILGVFGWGEGGKYLYVGLVVPRSRVRLGGDLYEYWYDSRFNYLRH